MALDKATLDAYIQALYDDDGQLSSADYQLIINYILSNGEPETDPRDLIQIRRGNAANLPTLAQGEPAFTLDEENLVIGGLNGNILIPSRKDLFRYGVDVTFFGAHSRLESGYSTFDSTQAFQDAIAYAKSSKQSVYVPDGEFILTQGITLNDLVGFEMNENSYLYFTLANNTDIAIKIDSSERVSYKFGTIESTNGKGTGIQLKDSNFNRLNIGCVKSFITQIHVLSETNMVLDNDIDINLLGSGTHGLLIETKSPTYTVEGTRFQFNFISEVQYGIYFKRNPGAGGILYSDIRGTAIHCIANGAHCIYFSSQAQINANYFEIHSFMESDLGTLIGGDYTYNSESAYANIENSYFKMFINNALPKNIKMCNGMNTIENTCAPYSHHAAATGFTPTTTHDSGGSFNGGIRPDNNYILITATIDPANIGINRKLFAYSNLTGNGSPKPVKLIPVSGNFENYNIIPIDNSHNYPYEIDIDITNVAVTSSADILKFYLELH